MQETTGRIEGGVVVLDQPLPEGTQVFVRAAEHPPPFPPELQAEIDLWRSAGASAWALIDEWEREDWPGPAGREGASDATR